MPELYNNLPVRRLTNVHFTGSALLADKKPANETAGIFYAQREPLAERLYAVDAAQRTILTCYARADFHIYRRNDAGEEWYELLTADEIAKGRVNFFKYNADKNLNIDHTGEDIRDKVTVVDSFLLSEHHKLDYPEFAELAPGSWMIGYYIHDDELLSRLTGANSLEAVSQLETAFTAAEGKMSESDLLLILSGIYRDR